MTKYLLDSSFLIDLLNELAEGAAGPALRWVERHKESQLWISPVSLAEVLEGAARPTIAKDYLSRYRWQGIARVHAEKAAIRQRRSPRRMGENDAWQVAIADHIGAIIVGHDPEAFGRLGARYEDHWK